MHQVAGASGLLLALLALVGCAYNSEITRSFLNPEADSRGLEGVLIIGVSTDAEVRADFEQAFARALRQRGVQAETSYTRVADPEADAEVFVAAARRAGVDSILVTRYVGQRVEEVYHPGYYYYDSMPAYGGVYEPLGDYYGHAWGMAYEQPVWTANRTYTLISDLFAVEGGQHIWQAVSDTVRSGSDRKLRDDIIRSFVSDLRDRGLLN